MKSLGSTELKRLHRSWRARSHRRLALLLDNVQGPFNVGGIVRMAAAERVDHLYLVGATPPLDAAKVGKTALGTERYVTWSMFDTLPEALDRIKGDGYALIGIELADQAVPLHEIALTGDVCLAVGHEDHGLSALTLAACDAAAYIPQMGRVGSLNVAQAASIAIYEARRREWTS
ncbi:MAG: TrmH family RNA methyltransferase [Actinobacteria bacterium]|nr:TrmH family RNA methyltransferase [Actinomycetota bacterium]